MKKYVFIICAILIFSSKVNAQEIYYENDNGVKLTEQEYITISEFYWEGYQDYLSYQDFKFLSDNGLFENEINTIEINDNSFNMLSDATHTTANKTLKMSTACSSTCLVSVSLNWINLPKVRSYDLLGVYLNNTSVVKIGSAFVYTNKGTSSYSYTNKTSNGVGTTFLLPTDVTSLKISQTFTVEKKGTINASYQHAIKTVSYTNSQKYSFSSTGIGGVFSFNTGIQDYYDCMNGVSVNLV